MENFTRKSVSKSSISEEDKGVYVRDVVELAKSNKFYEELSELLNIKDIIDDFIEIPGAQTLVNSLKAEDVRFKKFDLEANYNALQFKRGEADEFYITFTNIENEDVLEIVGDDKFTCRMEYSAQHDFFRSLFSMQSFASDLTKKGYAPFVYSTLENLRVLYKDNEHNQYYRILKDREGIYYLRAIISEKYNDYSNNITAFLGLIGIHYEIKKTKEKFYISRFDFNESFVRVLFAKEKNRVIDKIGEMKYVIEVSNDEIKREAVRFIGAASILYGGKNGDLSGEVYIKPDNVRSQILSISHGSRPETAIKALASLENYVGKEEEMYTDIQNISKIDNPNTIKHLIFNRINNSNKPQIKSNKNQLLAELNGVVDTLYDLFKVLNKVEYLTNDIEAKEYLRFLFFDALIYRRLRREENNEDTVD